MRVYVQVPVSGRNFEEALKECDKRCMDIATKGHDAVNPLRVLDLPRDTASREAIGRCIALLMTCDAIYVHPNATEPGSQEDISAGCLAEAHAALAYDLKFIWDNKHADGRVDFAIECDDACAEQLVATTAMYKVTPTALILRDRIGDKFGSSYWGNLITMAEMIAAKRVNDENYENVFRMAELMVAAKTTD